MFSLTLLIIFFIDQKRDDGDGFFVYYDSSHTVIEKILITVNIFHLMGKYGFMVTNFPLGRWI